MTERGLDTLQTVETKIAKVDVTQYHSGIPLNGLENVTAALYIYSTGRSRSSRATENDLLGNVAALGGAMGLNITLEYGNIRKSGFVEEMMQEARLGLSSRGRWSRHYDYDGQGVFHKTSVEITKLEDYDDAYLLCMHAAYVGKEVENGLAESLGVEQGLQWKNVAVVFEPDGKNFKIDFAGVAKRLQDIYLELNAKPNTEPSTGAKLLLEKLIGPDLRSKKLTGESILKDILDGGDYDDSGTVVLGVINGLEVTLNLGRVERRFIRKNGKVIKDLWHVEGTTLSGPLDESYEKEGELEPPSISIGIRRYSKEKYNRLPAIEPAMKAEMNELAEKIANAFRK